MEKDVLITDDAVVLGLLVSCLGLIFYTSQLKSLKNFYKIIPALLLCYLIPSLFSTAVLSLQKFLDYGQLLKITFFQRH
jgi:hypothetical protein